MAQQVRLTADDLWETPDDGNRYEVIEGTLFVSPPPNLKHQRTCANLFRLLDSYVRAHGLGEVLFSPIGVVLSPDTAVQPDLVFVANERKDRLSDRGIEGSPNLVVEVQSPSTAARDKKEKLQAYYLSGVQEYWLVDPRDEAIQVLALTRDGFEEVGTYRGATQMNSRLLPDFRMPARDLFA